VGDRFAGKTALVTGGSNGIGRAITQALLADGAHVGILDLQASSIFAGNEDVLTVVGDVADPAIVGQAFDAIIARWGSVDLLVNDAAAYPNALVVDMSVEEWRRVFEVNASGTFLCCQTFARLRLGVGGGGKIVNITTGSARSPRPAGSAYAASKSAIETLTETLAMELGPQGINVNVVAPGYIDVRGWTEAFPDRASDDLRARLVGSIPLGVAGRPTDIANAVLFLLSEEAGHISGAVLAVDGGSGAGRFGLRP
jgi:NAD(P)-dependent dehydrogenase (short-subunit alcohol dehydrogenase family)